MSKEIIRIHRVDSWIRLEENIETPHVENSHNTDFSCLDAALMLLVAW